MEPISNADRIMAILRQRLREQAKPTSEKRDATPANEKPLATGLSALGALYGASQEQRRRACIQALLADQLGSGLLNDSQFQQVVMRVVDAITEDPAAARLLDRVVEDLREA